jgi:hypothetical protein
VRSSGYGRSLPARSLGKREAERDGRGDRAVPVRPFVPVRLLHATVLFSEDQEHGRPSPVDPALDRAVRDVQEPGYLGVGEPLRVSQDQRRQVLGPDFSKGGRYLPMALCSENRGDRVGVTTRLLRQERLFAVSSSRLPACPAAEQPEARVGGDPIKPGGEGALPVTLRYCATL